MKKTNSTNKILLLAVLLSFFCSVFLGNIILGIVVFLLLIGFVIYTRRASFIGSMASSAYKKGDLEKSFALYEKAIAIESCPNMVKILYAYRLINEDKVKEGAKVLSALDPMNMNDNERFNYNATNALNIWKQGSIHRAIEIYESLLNDKDSLLIYETLGHLLLCSKDYEKALQLNLKALEFNNTSEMIRSNLATSYYYVGNRKEATKIYKELIEDFADFPEPYYYYGLILKEREKYKGALKYLNMALDKKQCHLSQLTHEEIQNLINEMTDYVQDLEEDEKTQM